MPTRRKFIWTSLLGLGAGVGLYTWRWEPHWIEVVERTLPIPHLPRTLRGARLVQLSDLHSGFRVDAAYLLRVFERVRRMEAEVIVYTGDFVDGKSRATPEVDHILARLPLGRRATFGILGNHDYGMGWRDDAGAQNVTERCRAAGVTILRNDLSTVDGLQVAGLDDLWAGRFDPQQVLSRLDPCGASILLSHNPDTADDPRLAGYRGWILAGHTHGGQCKPPFLPPPILPVKNKRYTAGEFDLGNDRRMYISRGVGHLLRVRFNVRPEVTVFRLEAA